MGKPLATRERAELSSQLQAKDIFFGDKVISSEPTKTVMFGVPGSHPADIILEVKENVYKSRKTEALGKGLDRNYVLPEVTKTSEFAFGVRTAGSELTRRPHHGRDFRRDDPQEPPA